MAKYDDIIGMEHHTSKTRPRMPIRDRAAQFAPFAALTGYDGMIEETARLTDDERLLGDEDTAMLDRKLRVLQACKDSHPYVEITHFVPDQRKSGGRYETAYGYLKEIDNLEEKIILTDKRQISFNKIKAIESTAFNEITFE